MSNDLEVFQARQADLLAIAEEDIKSSSMPINTYVQEALNLYTTAEEDFSQLDAAGMARMWLDELMPRISVLRAAQQNWIMHFQTKKEAEAQWAEASPDAYEVRAGLMRTMRFALRRNKEALNQLNYIDQGIGHNDMLGDLNNLAGLGRRYSEDLLAIKFDLTKLDEAEASSHSLGKLLALVNGDQLDGNKERIMRDRAYTYLKEVVDEVRDYGKYVFFNTSRIEGYQSNYYRSKNNKPAPKDDDK